MMDLIELHCLNCGRTVAYDRKRDRTIPATVVRIEQENCDICDEGDFSSETWFDADGREVKPE